MANKELKVSEFIKQAKVDGFILERHNVTDWERKGEIKGKRKKGQRGVLFVYDKSQLTELVKTQRVYKKSGVKKRRIKSSGKFSVVQAILEESEFYKLDPKTYIKLLDRAKAKGLT